MAKPNRDDPDFEEMTTRDWVGLYALIVFLVFVGLLYIFPFVTDGGL